MRASETDAESVRCASRGERLAVISLQGGQLPASLESRFSKEEGGGSEGREGKHLDSSGTQAVPAKFSSARLRAELLNLPTPPP